MISVICSTIKPGRQTNKSLRSILRTIGAGDELILHIDPHSDSDPSWAPPIMDSRLVVIRSEAHIGFSNGLNLAASHAKNEFLGRIDTDDIALPGRWQYQLKRIQGLDFHFGSMLHYFSGRAVPLVLPHYPVALSPEAFAVVAAKTNPGFHPAVLMRRSSFEQLGGYRETLSEDYDLWLRALGEGMTMSRGLRPVTIYRHHSVQATSAPDWESRVMKDPSTLSGQSILAELLKSKQVLEEKVLASLTKTYPMARVEFRKILNH